jgi:hypothetical protein
MRGLLRGLHLLQDNISKKIWPGGETPLDFHLEVCAMTRVGHEFMLPKHVALTGHTGSLGRTALVPLHWEWSVLGSSYVVISVDLASSIDMWSKDSTKRECRGRRILGVAMVKIFIFSWKAWEHFAACEPSKESAKFSNRIQASFW